jgi:hypothetical protein
MTGALISTSWISGWRTKHRLYQQAASGVLQQFVAQGQAAEIGEPGIATPFVAQQIEPLQKVRRAKIR